jgi:hypothetical protein
MAGHYRRGGGRPFTGRPEPSSIEALVRGGTLCEQWLAGRPTRSWRDPGARATGMRHLLRCERGTPLARRRRSSDRFGRRPGSSAQRGLSAPGRALPAKAQASSEIKCEQYSPSRPARRPHPRVPPCRRLSSDPNHGALYGFGPGEPEPRLRAHRMSSVTSTSPWWRSRERSTKPGWSGSGAARAH